MSADGLAAVEVSKRYGGVQVLDTVSLTAPPGQVTALIGPNGAGKSTLANVISGFVRPETGHVAVNGRRLAAGAGDRAGSRIGRTFQNLEVFTGMSVLENVMMGGYTTGSSGVLRGLARALLPGPGARHEERELRDRAMSVLADLGIDDTAQAAVESLPFGQAKLVEMARALVLDPVALVLDEPAAGLPPTAASSLAELIAGLAEHGIGVLLIEHNMRLVMQISRHIVVLDHGQILTEGAPAEVRSDPQVIEAYLGPGHSDLERELERNLGTGVGDEAGNNVGEARR